MTSVDHSVASEELMAYLDGELPPERAAAITSHLAHCEACQRAASDLQRVSHGLAAWHVAAAPTPRAPASPERPTVRLWHWVVTPSRSAFAVVGVAAVALVVTSAVLLPRPGRSRQNDAAETALVNTWPERVMKSPTPKSVALGGAATAPMTLAQPTAEQPRTDTSPGRLPAVPKVVHTVNLTVVARDFDAVRPELDRLLRRVGGFIGQMDASGDPKSLTATLRVPADRLDEAIDALRRLGRVGHETRSADDVTEQAVDLNARLANSRNTEQRLVDVLRNRTGRVADVLEVERELARVREEIERLDAERTNLERRVTYATVTLHVTQERQATLEIGPVPLRFQLRNALVDGIRDAFDGIVGTLLWVLRTGPVLLLWLAILWWPARRVLNAVRVRRPTAA